MNIQQTIEEELDTFFKSFDDLSHVRCKNIFPCATLKHDVKKVLSSSLRKVALAALDEIKVEDRSLECDGSDKDGVCGHYHGADIDVNQANSLIREQITQIKKELL